MGGRGVLYGHLINMGTIALMISKIFKRATQLTRKAVMTCDLKC